ncbi:hypothetical protein ACF1AO_29960 [Streptomyces longwoodensis]|uniref:hypothetical protein n=1 Tax=Streptomyces longwoodensis TaxID=68231 RepID=UPI0036FCD149
MTGDDERERGKRRATPLRVDGSRGSWDEIEELWLAGELTDEDFEDHFIDDVIVAEIGEGTDGWEFPGVVHSRTPVVAAEQFICCGSTVSRKSWLACQESGS